MAQSKVALPLTKKEVWRFFWLLVKKLLFFQTYCVCRQLGQWAGAVWPVATAAVLLISTTGLALCAGAVAVAVQYSAAWPWCS